MAQAPTVTRPSLFIKERAISQSPKHPGYLWTTAFDPTRPGKRMSIAFTEKQAAFINNAADNNQPLLEDVHYRYDPSKEGTFLLPSIGEEIQPEPLQEVPVIPQTNSRKIRKTPGRGTTNQEPIYDDLGSDDEVPCTWNIERDQRSITAENYAREMCLITERLLKEHPCLDSEDVRAMVITAFIQSHKR
jgi:hypothetical protein